MTELFEFFIVLICVWWLVRLISFLIARLGLFASIRSIGKIQGVSLKRRSILHFIMPISRKSVAIIEVHGVSYEVYLFSGESGFRFWHITGDKYAAGYSKFGSYTDRSPRAKLHMPHTKMMNMFPRGMTRPKVKRLPNPVENQSIPVLLFNPVPNEVTYVTPERTSIKLAFTGDMVGRWQIFTKKSFYNHIDRKSRGVDVDKQSRYYMD